MEFPAKALSWETIAIELIQDGLIKLPESLLYVEL